MTASSSKTLLALLPPKLTTTLHCTKTASELPHMVHTLREFHINQAAIFTKKTNQADKHTAHAHKRKPRTYYYYSCKNSTQKSSVTEAINNNVGGC